MLELTVAESEALIAAKLICLTRGKVTQQGLEDYRCNPHTCSQSDWTEALKTLVERGLLRKTGKAYHLTDAGRARAYAAHKEMLAESERAFEECKGTDPVDIVDTIGPWSAN